MATATHDEELSWERRFGPYAAAAAFGAVALHFAAVVAQIPILRDAPSTSENKRYKDYLLSVHDHGGSYVASQLLVAGASALVAGALFYLFRATRHRRAELPAFLRYVLVVAPVFMLVAAIVTQLNAQDLADQFVGSGSQTNARAKDLVKDNQSAVGGGLGLAGGLALALSFVLIGLNAMRAGLLSRFMGVLGIIVGVLLVIPLLPSPIPVVQVFWLVAVGFLFLGRWPGGRGPAWETGAAEPWPTPQERAGLARPGGAAETEAEPEAEAEEQPPQRASRKRKKKKRR
jgi:hypothetical protein